MTPGLANKICIPAASKVCCNFPETLKYLPEDKAVLTGSPIREELLHGDRLAGLQYAHLSADRPVILIIGGSLGSVTVNQAVRSILPQLLKTYQVIHICGKAIWMSLSSAPKDMFSMSMWINHSAISLQRQI